MAALIATTSSYASTRHEVLQQPLRQKLSELDAMISHSSPEVAELLAPRPENWSAVAAILQPGQALWLHTVFEDESYLFLVEPDRISVRRTEQGAEALADLTSALRASVDLSDPDHLPPFAFEQAEALFTELAGPFSDRLPDLRHLILVPDGAAQELSFAMLVRRDPSLPEHFGAGDPEYRFLGLTHGLSIVPSPRSLLRLHRSAEVDPGDGFMGFGDPVLNGSGEGDARRAIDLSSGLADPQVLATLFEPLPETAVELAQIAAEFVDGEVFLGPDATVTAVKSSEFDDTRIVSFATHAVVSGDFDYLTEPGLVLTPPSTSSETDDGLLTTSEIAALEIGAEMVLLSACNTGSTSRRPGAAGLSGLASGFFEAGVRSLVVTHWSIKSASALTMMPVFITNLTEGEGMEAPEAMRLTMWLTANNPYLEGFSHPALWAPFAVVGG